MWTHSCMWVSSFIKNILEYANESKDVSSPCAVLSVQPRLLLATNKARSETDGRGEGLLNPLVHPIGLQVVPCLHILLAGPPRRTVTGLIKGTWSSPDAGVPYYDDKGSAGQLVDIGPTRHPPPLLWAVWPEDLDAGCHNAPTTTCRSSIKTTSSKWCRSALTSPSQGVNRLYMLWYVWKLWHTLLLVA